MNSTQNEIDILRHEIMLGRDSPELQAKLRDLLVDNANTFREEMAILARFAEASRPVVKQFEQDEGAFRCRKCCRLLEPGFGPRTLCRGCEADENSEKTEQMYERL